MRSAVRRIGRWIGAGALFLLFANLKAVAEALGLDKLAANQTFLGALVAALTSRTAIAVGLIGLGIGLWAALDWMARKWDERHPSKDQLLLDAWPDMYDLSETIGSRLESGAAIPPMGLSSRIFAKFTTLRDLGLQCPHTIPLNHPRHFMATTKMFLDLIVPILREGQVRVAKEQASEATRQIEGHTEEQRAAIEKQIAEELKQAVSGL